MTCRHGYVLVLGGVLSFYIHNTLTYYILLAVCMARRHQCHVLCTCTLNDAPCVVCMRNARASLVKEAGAGLCRHRVSFTAHPHPLKGRRTFCVMTERENKEIKETDKKSASFAGGD